MRGHMHRYGIIHDQKYLDTSGFPITHTELLMNLETATYQYKKDAVDAARVLNQAFVAHGGKKCYAASILIHVAGTKAGKA